MAAPSGGTGSSGCTPSGRASRNGDGSDCCSGFVDLATGKCIACTMDGLISINGDGSDCCAPGNLDSNGDCVAAPVPAIASPIDRRR